MGNGVLRLRRGGFSIGITFLSFLLVSGGLVLAVILLAVAGMDGESATYGVMTLGAMIGGASAARLSLLPRVIEITLGGVLLGLFFAGCIYISGKAAWQNFSDNSLQVEVLKLSVGTAVGALAGALLGQRNRHWLARWDSLGWASLSGLMTGGYIMLVIMVLVAFGTDLDAMPVGWIFLILGTPCMLAAFTAQALSKVRRAWACASGGCMIMLYFVIGLGIDGDLSGEVLGGAAVLCLFALFNGWIGLTLATKLFDPPLADIPFEAEARLPEATLE